MSRARWRHFADPPLQEPTSDSGNARPARGLRCKRSTWVLSARPAIREGTTCCGVIHHPHSHAKSDASALHAELQRQPLQLQCRRVPSYLPPLARLAQGDDEGFEASFFPWQQIVEFEFTSRRRPNENIHIVGGRGRYAYYNQSEHDLARKARMAEGIPAPFRLGGIDQQASRGTEDAAE